MMNVSAVKGLVDANCERRQGEVKQTQAGEENSQEPTTTCEKKPTDVAGMAESMLVTSSGALRVSKDNEGTRVGHERRRGVGLRGKRLCLHHVVCGTSESHLRAPRP